MSTRNRGRRRSCRKIAQELGVELASVAGTGPGRDGSPRRTCARLRRRPVARDAASRCAASAALIADHLARAHREVPAVTFVEECDFTGVDLARLVPLVLRAAALSLKEFPELNARLEGDEIVYLDRYDLGLAVQTEQGLVVPVVRGCDTASLEELDAEVQRLAEAARAGTLLPEELRGSTFTVTSAGKLGGLLVTPLVNYPEVGILGVHRIGPRPVVRDGEVVVRQVGNVSVTFDHRVVDGARAAAFCLDVIGRLAELDSRRWAPGTRSASASGWEPAPGCSSPACSPPRGSGWPSRWSSPPPRVSASASRSSPGRRRSAAGSGACSARSARPGSSRGRCGAAARASAPRCSSGSRESAWPCSPLIPVVGYLEAVVIPVLAVRLRRRDGGRFAGLRILARD